MKCVAYCRVSSDNPEQITSLENQIRHYTELFKKNGFEGAECGMYYSKEGRKEFTKYLPSIFADEGISGTKLKSRGAFKYMLECAYRREYDAILVKNVQRWARNVEDGAGIIKKLKVMGIKVIFEDGWLDSSNPANEATINILFVMAQEESRAKSTAVQFGIRKAQESGKFTSASPYGYKSEKGFLAQIPEQIEIVKKIFDLYMEGWGSTRITQYLNTINIPTQKGRKWSTAQIYDILTNQIYIGKQITHTVVNTDVNIDRFEHKGKIYQSCKPVNEENWIVTHREVLRAVTDEVFENVQKEVTRRKELYKRNSRPSNAHIFSNLLYCRNCGIAMRRKKIWGWKRKDGTRNVGVEWVCLQHDKYNNDICRYRNSWNEEVLLNRIKEEIENLRRNRGYLDKMFSEYIRSFFSSEDIAEKLKELKDQLDELKSQTSANLKLFTKNIIDEEQYKQQNDDLQINKKWLLSNLNKVKNIDEASKQALSQYKNYIDFLNSVDVERLENVQLKKIVSRIEAFTIFDDDANEHKDIYIVWNMLDKAFDDLFYRNAANANRNNGIN